MTGTEQLLALRDQAVRALMERYIADRALSSRPAYFQMSRDEILQIFADVLADLSLTLARPEKNRLFDLLFAGPGGPLNLPGWWMALMDDHTAHEIIILGHREIFVKRDSDFEKLPHAFQDELHLQYVLNIVLNSSGKALTAETPKVDAQPGDGVTLTALMPPATDDLIYASLRIRREA